MEPSVVIIGGGPAGSSAGRLLASWGHRVLLLDCARTRDASIPGMAESLPPSSRKLLAQIGVLDLVERAGFYRSTGNTVWWGSDDLRVETFGANAFGLQVLRPAFDAVLREAAAAAGVDVRAGARARSVDLDDAAVRVDYEVDGRREHVHCEWVLDCSGRAGVLARRFRVPGTRMYAVVGEWQGANEWDVPDSTHTLVEAYESGWAWSIPLSATVRQAGLMIDGPSPRGPVGSALADAYRAEMAKAPSLARTLDGAVLRGSWACDASTYSSSVYGGHRLVLAGDAASFIDPLSSCGVKKALASGWIAAIVVNTCLMDSAREAAAIEFLSSWERDVAATHARRSRDFAVEAAARHPHRFWQERASIDLREPESPPLGDQNIAAALRAIRDAAELDFEKAPAARLRKSPLIRGREIVLEDAFTLPFDAARPGGDASPRRYINNVDLVALADLAVHHRHMPELFDAYCRTVAPAALPSVLGGLSLLVAAGVLRQRKAAPC